MFDVLNTLPMSLAGHRLFRSSDLDETRHRVTRVFSAHRLRPLDDTPLDAEMCRVSLGRISLNLLRYGPEIEIDPGRFDHFLTFQVPLQGRGRVTCGDETVEFGPGLGVIIEPHQEVLLNWSADCRQMILQIEKEVLEHWAERLIDRRVRGPFDFEPTVRLDTPTGLGLVSMLQYLISHAVVMKNAGGCEQMARSFEELVVRQLLFGQPNRYSALLGAVSFPSPRYVKRAEEFMEAHVDTALTLSEIAAHAQTSVRTLSAGFRRFRECSPMEAFRRIRLDRAHQALHQARGVTVAEIAQRHGFNHVGRFSAAYRERFGELPSETLATGRPS